MVLERCLAPSKKHTPHFSGRAGHRALAGDGSNLSAGLAALTQPFKLRLARAAHEEQLRDYGVHTVLIEPLASMAAVEDFLWSRVTRSAAERDLEAAERTAARRAGGVRNADIQVDIDTPYSLDACRLESSLLGKQASGGKDSQSRKEQKGAAGKGKEIDEAKPRKAQDPTLQWEASGTVCYQKKTVRATFECCDTLLACVRDLTK